MSETKDYYEILGVSRDATQAQLKKSWIKLMRQYHPDKLPEDKKEEGEQMSKQINKAYSVLKDPEKRKVYDQFGEAGINGEGGPGGFGNFNMDEIFEQMRRGGMGGFPFENFPGNGPRQKRYTVESVEFVKELTLEEIFKGTTVSEIVSRKNLCVKCEGTGYKDCKSHDCQSCGGSGLETKIQRMGPMVTQTKGPCSKCRGSSKDNSGNYPKCEKCNGTQFVTKKVKVTFDLPKGIQDGMTYPIDNQGNEIPKEFTNNSRGITRGPIHCIIKEIDHPVYRRGVSLTQGQLDPANIVAILKIPFAEAMVGFVKEIKHLDNTTLSVVESEPITDGQVKVIVGKGMPVMGSDYKVGDLFIKYEVEQPKNLTLNQRKQMYNILTGKKYTEPTVNPDTIEANMVNLEKYNEYQRSKNGNGSGNGARRRKGPRGFPQNEGPGCPVQ